MPTEPPPPQLQPSYESQSLSFISDQLHVPSQIHRFYCLTLGWQRRSCDTACLAFRHFTAMGARSVCAACQVSWHIAPSPSSPCLLVLICTCRCPGSIRDHQILLVGTVRSGYIKEIRGDQTLERDRLQLPIIRNRWRSSLEEQRGDHHL